MSVANPFCIGVLSGMLLVSGCGGGGSTASAPADSSGQSVGTVKQDTRPTTPAEFGLFPLAAADSPAQCANRATGGIEGTGLRHRHGIVRVVTASALTVDDYVFAASDAAVYVNGACAALTDVRVGDAVTVIGTEDSATRTGTAVTVFADESLSGAVLALDSVAGTLNVIGQPVVVTVNTVFGDDIRPGSLTGLAPYENVAVYGTMRTDGVLTATRIDRWHGSEWGATGTVTAVDSTAKTVSIGALPIRFADARLVGYSGGIQVGDQVRVLGAPLWTVVDAPDGGIAASVIQHAVLAVPAAREVVLSGLITAARTPYDFDVMGQRVTATKEVLRGYDATGWYPGTFVTVFGSLDDSGTTVADVIEVQNGADVLAQGPITRVDRDSGSVELMGVPVEISRSTFLQRVTSGTARPIGIDELSVGDSLAVEGAAINGGRVAALLVRAFAPSDKVYTWSGINYGESHEPIVALRVGGTVRADTTSGNFYFGHTMPNMCSCRASSARSFWDRSPLRFGFTSIEVLGTWSADHIVAADVIWLEE